MKVACVFSTNGENVKQEGRQINFPSDVSYKVKSSWHKELFISSLKVSKVKILVKRNSMICIFYLVVEAWAMMLPPIGFFGSAENIAAPSTWATTWWERLG